MAPNLERDHPRPRLTDASRVDGVKKPQHRGTARYKTPRCTFVGSFVSAKISNNSSLDRKKNLRERQPLRLQVVAQTLLDHVQFFIGVRGLLE